MAKYEGKDCSGRLIERGDLMVWSGEPEVGPAERYYKVLWRNKNGSCKRAIATAGSQSMMYTDRVWYVPMDNDCRSLAYSRIINR